MMSKFKEMLAKKKDLKPSEKHAKMGVLKDMKDALGDEMGNKLDGLKKVSVMSNSPQGLQAGLSKAQQMASQSPDDQDPSQMMSEGGLANAGMVDSEESYNGFGPMDENAKSKDMDPMEPEHVMYDGSSDQEMGPGYAEGGMIGPNEALAKDVTYSGSPDDDGFMHPDSDESSEVDYSGDASKDDGFKHPDSDESEHGDGYAQGGKVKSQLDEAADSAQEERDETMSDEGDDNDDEHSENVQKLQARIDHLMRLKKQMEQQ